AAPRAADAGAALGCVAADRAVNDRGGGQQNNVDGPALADAARSGAPRGGRHAAAAKGQVPASALSRMMRLACSSSLMAPPKPPPSRNPPGRLPPTLPPPPIARLPVNWLPETMRVVPPGLTSLSMAPPNAEPVVLTPSAAGVAIAWLPVKLEPVMVVAPRVKT